MILSIVTCIECAAGMHHLCGDDSCCCPDDPKTGTLEDLPALGSMLKNQKTNNVMDDPISTGRKRAALLYAFPDGTICEWAWKKNCGGGPYRVVGCTGRLATNIHHGPNKSTLNNRPDNISVICSFCHNLWHGNNDRFYLTERPKDNGDWLPTTYGRLDEMIDAHPGEVLAQEIKLKRKDIDFDRVNARMQEVSEEQTSE